MAQGPVFSGITQSLAKSRLETEGTSSIFRFHSRNPRKILRAIFDPFTAMMALGCVVLLMTGGAAGWRAAAVLAALLAGFLTQRWRAKIRLERWREWATCRPQVIRDGRTFRIPHSELVREDLVLLEQGDRIPAEAELLAGSPIELSLATPTHEMLAPGSIVTRGSGVVRIRTSKKRPRDLPSIWIESEEGRGT
jgi:Ca2+-transporting ATPase